MADGEGKSCECSASATSLNAAARVGLPLRVFDPELALIRANAVDRSLVEFSRFAVAGYIH